MSIVVEMDWQRGDFSLQFAQEFPVRGVTALFGPSGCGKTSILRVLAGLERVAGARVRVGERVWQDEAHFLPPHERGVACVFQEAGLFSHLTVERNLRYGLDRAPQTGRRMDLGEIIAMLDLGTLLQRKPVGLSGGEKQRVAIGRALAMNPGLLLLDEPLSALDIGRKQEFLPYLEKLLQQLEIPAIYVSHAPEEVARLADHVVLMEAGRVLASGAVGTVFNRLDLGPAHERGARSTIRAVVTEHDARFGISWLAFEGGRLAVASCRAEPGAEMRVQIAATDVSVTLSRQEDSSILNILPAVIDELVPEGEAEVIVRLLLGVTPILARITRKSAFELGLEKGRPVYAQIKGIALAS